MALDEGAHEDVDPELVAEDEGHRMGAGVRAEEAAVDTIEEESHLSDLAPFSGAPVRSSVVRTPH